MERIALNWDIISSVRSFPLFYSIGVLYTHTHTTKTMQERKTWEICGFQCHDTQIYFESHLYADLHVFQVAGYFLYALMYRFIHPDVQVNVKKTLFFLLAFTNIKQSISSIHLIPHLTDCLPWNVCDVACQFSLPFDQ